MYKAVNTNELLKYKLPNIKHYIPGLLFPGCRCILFGKWGSYKSLLLVDMAFKLATGQQWLKWKTEQARVLVAQTEMPTFMAKERVEKYVSHNLNSHKSILEPANQTLLWLNEESLKLDNVIVLKYIKDMVQKYNIEVLMLDPIYRTITHDINKPMEVSRWLDNVDSITKLPSKPAIVLVGHPRKPATDIEIIDYGQELFGSSYFGNWPDTIIFVRRREELDTLTRAVNPNVEHIELQFIKTRYSAELLEPITIAVDKLTLRFNLLAS